MGDGRRVFKIVTGKPTGKRPRVRWEDIIRMNLKNINTRNRVDSLQDRDYWRALMNTALNLRGTQTI